MRTFTSAPRTLLLHLGIGLATGLAFAGTVLALAAPAYAASTSVLVEPLNGGVNLGTEAELVRASQTATDAFARLTGDPAQPPVAGRLTAVEAVPGTSVLVITFEAGSAEAARAGSDAFAEAYLTRRADAARAVLDDQIVATETRLDDIRTQLGGVTMLISQLPADAAELGSLRAAQESLTTEAAELTGRLHELRMTVIDAGRIIEQAPLPTAPVRPDRPLWLGTAAVGGVLAGLVLHLIRTRWSRRVRRFRDLRRHRNVPVLAEIDPAHERASRTGTPFNRLRNEIVAALAPADRVVLVTGVAPGPASTLVAANLAAAFARADGDVVLVGASPAELPALPQAVPTLAGIFDTADIPGLTDVLAGRTTLARAVQPAPRHPRLRLITPGGTATASGLLQSEGARSVLRQLATRARHVIVDAPSTAAGADAQSLAGAADVAVLVVELDRAEHAQVADAATQLARVGTRLLGAVVVPPLIDPPSAPGPSAVGHGSTAYQTEAWIGGRSAALDGPTRKLDPVNRRPRALGQAGPGSAAAEGPDPATADRTESPPAETSTP